MEPMKKVYIDTESNLSVEVNGVKVDNPEDHVTIRKRPIYDPNDYKNVDRHWENRLKAQAIKTKRNRKANKVAKKARRK